MSQETILTKIVFNAFDKKMLLCLSHFSISYVLTKQTTITLISGNIKTGSLLFGHLYE